MFKEKDWKKCDQLFRKYYSGRKFSRTLYLELIRKYVSTGDRVLDAGCGHYLEFCREFSPDVQVIGVDLEEKLDTHNEASPFAVRSNLESLPFPPDSFDLVISRSVVEHLENPQRVFEEFRRILKPGGKVIFSTPNKYDYISIFASLTPYRWHRSMVSRLLRVSEDDIFPTLYRANTLSALNRTLTGAGLKRRELEAVNHYPVYLMFSPLLFRLGVWYERLTSQPRLDFLRGTLLCVYEKEAAGFRQPGGLSRKERPVGAADTAVRG
jgi:SAM-dependent methyltransferase